LRAFELIITLDPEVVGITARSLYISLASVFLSSLIDIPLGAMIESKEFWGKRGIISLIHTLYSLPTVTVGLLVYLILSRNGPLGSLEILYTPAGMVLGQMILITPIMIGLTISALGEVSPQVKDTAKSLGASELQIMITTINEVRSAIAGCGSPGIWQGHLGGGRGHDDRGEHPRLHARAHHSHLFGDIHWQSRALHGTWNNIIINISPCEPGDE